MSMESKLGDQEWFSMGLMVSLWTPMLSLKYLFVDNIGVS